MAWIPCVATLALAGYGDAVDGYPTHAEREVHLWTNAVRVDPTAFDADYAGGGCSSSQFQSDERVAKDPLLYNADLNRASRAHSTDMRDHNWFDHDSWDGTSWDVRISSYYSGWSSIGENIAYGYPTSQVAVLQGWMCSSGHRENIMSANFNELGTGVVSTYYTQDFGLRNAATPRVLAMGLHLPATPTSTATFYVDLRDGGAPDAVDVVLDGVAHPMALEWGEPDRGVYAADVAADSACHLYWFRAMSGDGSEHRFPEDGSYGWGSCAWDDVEAGWIDVQQEDAGGPDDTDTGGGGGPGPGPDPGDDTDDTTPGGGTDPLDTGAADTGGFSTGKTGGCAAVPTPAAPWLAWAGLLVVGLRRRARRA